MTYLEFKENILHDITLAFPEETSITIRSILKNNDTRLDGLVIMEQDANIAPTLYLNHYFKELDNGFTYQEMLFKIKQDYELFKPTSNVDISFFTDYQKAQDHIVYKLINYEKNIDLLKEIPHVHFMDLAIVFYYLHLDDSYVRNGMVLIRNDLLESWNISIRQLMNKAIENTPITLPSNIISMQDMLKTLLQDDKELEQIIAEDKAPIPMYVITNTEKINGAAVMLYPNVLKNLAQTMKSDLYIIPSSVHEIIAIPQSHAKDKSALDEMVVEVNQDQVPDEEILSDHVYYYSLEQDQIIY
ncbi:DUF5688 family protein [Eubacterium oxidoreducens]|uniref:Uncharacterized protein n=1 Tax=Eubacterium oxidoreducens TaxID=1732 RepID=A0A1G6AKA0_EUBOX|nr:DUF5688 family protein [Eubacterium oxidoreducens]SDB08720.1 hypothetical protein SAMN02910417_00608 [Eubacterium oxidoreducens]